MILAKGFPILLIFAFQYLNTPYKWAGQDFTRLDCSGLVVKVLQDAKILRKDTDFTAQSLYNFFMGHELTLPLSRKQAGSILFYGKSTSKITHVDFCVNPQANISIGASGGDSTTLTLQDAIERDARVQISFIRKDLVASLTLDL